MRLRFGGYRLGAAIVSVLVAMLLIPTAAWAVNQLRWDVTFGSGAPGGTTAVAVAHDPSNNNVYVLARDDCCPHSRYDTLAYNSGGLLLWLAASNTSEDFPADIVVDPATHDVIVTGTRASTGHSLYTINYTEGGVVVWTRGLASGSGRSVSAAAIAVDGAGHVIVAGTSTLAGDGDYLTVEYRISDGTLRWHNRYSGPFGNDRAVAVAADPARHSVYVTGTSQGHNFAELTTVAYTADTGVQQWVARDTGNKDHAFGLAVDPVNHQVYAVSGSAGGHMAIYAYSANGTALWDTGDDDPHAVAGSPRAGVAVDVINHRVYVAGEQVTGTTVRTKLAAFSSSGTLAWSRTLHSGDGDLAVDVATDSSHHRVYVAGQWTGAGGQTVIATYAESSTGTSVWTAAHASPAKNGAAEPASITVDEVAQQVYVAGYEDKSGTTELDLLAYWAYATGGSVGS